jgi:hypothetical protein
LPGYTEEKDMNLKALRQREHDLKADGRTILDKAEKEGGALTADEESRFAAIELELTELAGQIDAVERLAERRHAAGAPSGRSGLIKPPAGDGLPVGSASLHAVTGNHQPIMNPRRGSSGCRLTRCQTGLVAKPVFSGT